MIFFKNSQSDTSLGEKSEMVFSSYNHHLYNTFINTSPFPPISISPINLSISSCCWVFSSLQLHDRVLLYWCNLCHPCQILLISSSLSISFSFLDKQCSKVVKGIDSGARLPGMVFLLCHLPTVWPLASYLISQALASLSIKWG